MRSEKIVDQIERLIDEKLRLTTILNSKGLGENKELLFNDSRKKIEQIKSCLVETLKNQ